MNLETKDNSRPGIWFSGLFLAAAARPHLLLPAWLAALTGAAAEKVAAPVPDWPVGLTIWSCALLAANLMNLPADRLTDQINQKNLTWNGVLPPSHIMLAALCLALGSVALASLFQPRLVLPVIATLILAVLYSLPPGRLCGRPGWDVGVHLTGYAMVAPWAGSIMASPASATNVPENLGWLEPVLPGAGPASGAMLWLALPVGVAFFLTAVLDLKGDRQTGKQTTAVWLADRWPLWDKVASAPTPRRVIIFLIATGVLLAGMPGLRQWPWSWPWILTWLFLGYGWQWGTGQLARATGRIPSTK